MEKKNSIMSVFGGSGGTAATTAFFLKLCKIYVKIRLFSCLTYVLRLKPSLKTTDYMKVEKTPPPPWFTRKQHLSGHLLHGEISINSISIGRYNGRNFKIEFCILLGYEPKEEEYYKSPITRFVQFVLKQLYLNF